MDEVTACFNRTRLKNENVRPIVASFIFISSLISTILNIFLLSIVIKFWNTNFRKQPFCYFVIIMTIPGGIYAATNLIVSGPCSISDCSFISSDWLMIVLATPNTLSHWGYLLAAFSFSIYRFSVFLSSRKSNSKYVIMTCLLSPWLLSAFITFTTTFTGCYKRFNRYALQYTYNCSECSMFYGLFTFQDFNFWAGQILPVIMLSLYSFIIISIQQKQRSQAMSRELHLTTQYFIICLFQYLSSFLFYIIPKIGTGSAWDIIAMNIIGVLNVSVNPIVLFCFNGQIRNSAANMIDTKTMFSKTNHSTRIEANRPTRVLSIRSTVTTIAAGHFIRAS
ncbi:unnamed protein product [Auanema sp. JU1783]|nr:unnamed protein product [Auanema sp. JU1783]